MAFGYTFLSINIILWFCNTGDERRPVFRFALLPSPILLLFLSLLLFLRSVIHRVHAQFLNAVHHSLSQVLRAMRAQVLFLARIDMQNKKTPSKSHFICSSHAWHQDTISLTQDPSFRPKVISFEVHHKTNIFWLLCLFAPAGLSTFPIFAELRMGFELSFSQPFGCVIVSISTDLSSDKILSIRRFGVPRYRRLPFSALYSTVYTPPAP